MTDKEKLVSLLTEFGIEWRETSEGIKCGGWNTRAKIRGWSGFYTLFEFNEDDSFKVMGAWD